MDSVLLHYAREQSFKPARWLGRSREIGIRGKGVG